MIRQKLFDFYGLGKKKRLVTSDVSGRSYTRITCTAIGSRTRRRKKRRPVIHPVHATAWDDCDDDDNDDDSEIDSSSLSFSPLRFVPSTNVCMSAGPLRVSAVLFRQRGRARSVSQVHPEAQEERHHAHERHGHHAAGPVAGERRGRLNGRRRGWFCSSATNKIK